MGEGERRRKGAGKSKRRKTRRKEDKKDESRRRKHLILNSVTFARAAVTSTSLLPEGGREPEGRQDRCP